jgi:hypothetical protein
VNTTDPAFFRQQSQGAGLDTVLQCSNSFENSYTLDFSGREDERFYTYTDITDFAFSVPTERPVSNAIFSEGLHFTQPLTVSLRGASIHQGEEEVYYNVSHNGELQVNRCPPVLCLVQDGFLVFSAQNGGTATHETTVSWNDWYRSYVTPEIYERMKAMYSLKNSE